MIAKLRAEGKTVCGYGAPAKATTIINFCGLTPQQIEYIVDDNPLKQGRYVPGGNIAIVPSSYLEANPANFVLIFAWNFAKEIIGKISHLENRGVQFIVPLPEPRLVSGASAALK